MLIALDGNDTLSSNTIYYDIYVFKRLYLYIELI